MYKLSESFNKYYKLLEAEQYDSDLSSWLDDPRLYSIEKDDEYKLPDINGSFNNPKKITKRASSPLVTKARKMDVQQATDFILNALKEKEIAFAKARLGKFLKNYWYNEENIKDKKYAYRKYYMLVDRYKISIKRDCKHKLLKLLQEAGKFDPDIFENAIDNFDIDLDVEELEEPQ